MQAQTPEVSSEKATTPRYDTIVIRGAKGQNVPKEVDGGEVVAWSRGHELAAMDALEEFVADMADGNCSQPEHLTHGAAYAMNLMRRRRDLGWDAGEPNPERVSVDGWTHDKPAAPGAYWVRGNLLQADALVQVKEFSGALCCNLHGITSEQKFGFTIHQLSEDFEWLGPLAPMGGRHD
ncbi:hypothetical protein [Pseudomonas leptonychotis]|uniref:Uncharacterized protein n=1 Tax=Pseudomonas leptonychotis TaxID=2448482 RepID=A0A4T2A1B0_9PSED|nr:hypothetical protein [Pseudomonas leptonychotis]TIH10805.1 hypothetical protein D8779_09045 [Pseudomonas leptonychotis]